MAYDYDEEMKRLLDARLKARDGIASQDTDVDALVDSLSLSGAQPANDVNSRMRADYAARSAVGGKPPAPRPAVSDYNSERHDAAADAMRGMGPPNDYGMVLPDYPSQPDGPASQPGDWNPYKPPQRAPMAMPAAAKKPAALYSPEEFAQANEADSSRARSRGIEAAGRQLLAGMTGGAPQSTMLREGDALDRLIAMKKSAREAEIQGRYADNAQERNATNLETARLNMENARTRAERDAAKFEYDRLLRDRQETRADKRLDLDTDKAGDATRLKEAALKAKAAGAAAGRVARDEKAALKAKTALNADVDGLRKEFNNLKEVKDFKDATTSYEKIQAAAKNPSAAGDLSLIFAYMKVLDPGSTVREGEFDNAQNAAGADTKLINAINKVRNGERLSTAQRADFIDQAKRLHEAQRTNYSKAAKTYRGLAEKSGGDPNDVTGEMDAEAPTGGGMVDVVSLVTGKTVHVSKAAADAAIKAGKARLP